MKVLLVKTSSLGDVIHALPAVTEAANKIPGLSVDWVVEEGFAAIPAAHPAVDNVIPVAVRRWRKNWLSSRHEISQVRQRLRSGRYDLVVDSQGLLKSALLSRLAGRPVCGFDGMSAREPLASLFYGRKHRVAPAQHAIHRQKQLLASSLGYEVDGSIDYGLGKSVDPEQKIMLLHGTTWRSKELPEFFWVALADLVRLAGYEPCVPSGSDEERARAMRILGGEKGLLHALPLDDLVGEFRSCVGAVSVDTGLGHLAPALGIPVVAAFGATDPALTGILGKHTTIIASTHLPCIPCRKRECQYPIPDDSSNIYPPCYEQTSPESVWQALQLLIGSKDTKPA